MDRIWVARLGISPATAAKLSSKHGLDAEEVRKAVECVPGLGFWWDDDPERGLRALLYVQIRDRQVLVTLYEADDPLGDVWNLGSAY
jgi:hypothetical protein